ncbi:VanZ family protein [Chitinophaga sp.]|uniref:VanZ family protein n=1 Tax=Chitinophaga sp. TaxID=1869181 RepID=UPI002F955D8D
MNKKSAYIIALSTALAFTLFEELKLRPYLFKHHLNIIAGSLPNFLAVVIPFLGYALIKFPLDERKARSVITSFVIGLSLYEICQIWMPQRTFDLKDVIASILGGFFSYLIFYIIDKVKPSTRQQH